VLDVPRVGDDPPVLVMDLVCLWSEHFVDDERPLPRWRQLVSVLAALNSSENEVPDVELARPPFPSRGSPGQEFLRRLSIMRLGVNAEHLA
jgi:hypothetical protein